MGRTWVGDHRLWLCLGQLKLVVPFLTIMNMGRHFYFLVTNDFLSTDLFFEKGSHLQPYITEPQTFTSKKRLAILLCACWSNGNTLELTARLL